MAIDTPAKRASALTFMQPTLVLPPPDGVIAQADRQSIVVMYGGILAAALFVRVFLHEKLSISIGHIGF